jgi:hypothetical protein
MPIYQVLFSKEFEVFIEAESPGKIQEALKKVSKHEIDWDWDTANDSWDISVYPKPCKSAPKDEEPMGIVDGEVVSGYDWKAWKEANPDESEKLKTVEERTLPLFPQDVLDGKKS